MTRLLGIGIALTAAGLVATPAAADTHVERIDGWYDGYCTVCKDDYACASGTSVSTGTWEDDIPFLDPLPAGVVDRKSVV